MIMPMVVDSWKRVRQRVAFRFRGGRLDSKCGVKRMLLVGVLIRMFPGSDVQCVG